MKVFSVLDPKDAFFTKRFKSGTHIPLALERFAMLQKEDLSHI
jgi:hypothetical protein